MASYNLEQLPKELQKYLDAHPTPTRFLNVGKLLVQSGVQPVKKPLKKISLSRDQQEQYQNVIIQELSASSEDLETLRATMEVTAAIISQHVMYIDCAHIAKNYPPRPYLVEEFRVLMQGYVDYLIESAVIATPMAAHGALFDTFVVPYCADESVSVQERKKRVQSYMLAAREHGEQARDMVAKMKARLKEFEDKWDSLTGQAGFPRERCPIRHGSSRSLLPDVEFDLPILAQMATQTGTLAASQTIKALIALGAPESFDVALSIAVAANWEERRSIGITAKSCDSLYAFQDSAEIIWNFWNYTDKDALAIETWLDKGASNADIPPYMKSYLDKGARLYLSISYRLAGYSTAILLANPLAWMKWFDK